MKVASIAEVKSKLSAFLVESMHSGPIVITRNGKAVGVLIAPQSDDDLEDILLTRSPKLTAMLNHSRRQLALGKGLPDAEFWRKVDQRSKRRRAAQDAK